MAGVENMETEDTDTTAASYKSSGGKKDKRQRRRKRRNFLTLERSSNIRKTSVDDQEASSSSSGDFAFKVVKTVVEHSHKRAIYAVAFNHYVSGSQTYFATAAGNMINIYACYDVGNKIELKRCIVDTNTTEDYFALDWCYDLDQNQCRIVVSGESAIIKVLDPVEGVMLQEKFGHGDTINELKTDPNNSMIFASVSKDNSIRIWHLRDKVALICLAGQRGHVDQVLSCDWSPDSAFLATCSMDHSIRMWRFDKKARQILHKKEHKHLDVQYSSDSDEGDDNDNENNRIGPYFLQFPNNECSDLHSDYVDCVRFIGYWLISKGSEKGGHLFRFGHAHEEPLKVYRDHTDRVTTRIRQFSLPTCDVWFLKFDVSPLNDWVVFGGTDGVLYFFDLLNPVEDPQTENGSVANFKLKVLQAAIRQIVFDQKGENIIVVGDDYTVVRLQRTKVQKNAVNGH